MEVLGVNFGSREWCIKNPMCVLTTVDGSEIRRAPIVVNNSYEIWDILDINGLTGFLSSTVILRINLCVPGPCKGWLTCFLKTF